MTQYTLRLDDDFGKKLTECKLKHGFGTTSEIIRAAIRHYLKYLESEDD